MKITSSLSRCALRTLSQTCHAPSRLQALRPISIPSATRRQSRTSPFTRTLTSSTKYRIALTPGSSEPDAPKTETHDDSQTTGSAAELSDGQYHDIADKYINRLLLALEEKAEASSDTEVEYSVRFVLYMLSYHRTYASLSSGPLTDRSPGWRSDTNNTSRHIHTQQAATQQTDLALIARLRPKALRLGATNFDLPAV